jgi:hypothetical protein
LVREIKDSTRSEEDSIESSSDSKKESFIPESIEDVVDIVEQTQGLDDPYRFCVSELSEILRQLAERNVSVRCEELLARLLTLACWPYDVDTSISVFLLLIEYKEYVCGTCGIPRSDFANTILSQIHRGLLLEPREPRVISTAMVVLSQLFEDENSAIENFSNMARSLQLQQSMNLDVYRIVLSDDFDIIRTEMSRHNNWNKENLSIQRIEKKVANINKVIDDRNRDVICFNVAMILRKIHHPTRIQASSGENGEEPIIDTHAQNGFAECDCEELEQRLGKWTFLTIQSDVDLDRVILPSNFFFVLAYPVEKVPASGIVTFSINEMLNMSSLHPREFLEWVEEWMKYHVDCIANVAECSE